EALGVSRATAWSWCNGRHGPRPHQLQKIIRYTKGHVSLGDLKKYRYSDIAYPTRLGEFLRQNGLKASALARTFGVPRPTVDPWCHGRAAPNHRQAEEIVHYADGRLTLSDLAPLSQDPGGRREGKGPSSSYKSYPTRLGKFLRQNGISQIELARALGVHEDTV